MKTLWYRQRRQRLYVLPGHCAILTQLYAPKVYVHAPLPLQSFNRRSLAGPLNVITGSSEPLTDTCWGPGSTQAPPKKSHYHQVTYLRLKWGDQSRAIFIMDPAASLHHQEGKLFEDKWSSILLRLVSPIIKVQGSFTTREGLTHTHLSEGSESI